MQIECLITYTDPEGKRWERGQLYQVDAEDGLWLTMAAEGQFKVIDDGGGADVELKGSADDGTLKGPPADRMVRRSPRLRQAQPPARGR